MIYIFKLLFEIFLKIIYIEKAKKVLNSTTIFYKFCMTKNININLLNLFLYNGK